MADALADGFSPNEDVVTPIQETAGMELIRRYRVILIAALPSGFLLGAIVFLGFSVFGNPDWRAYLTPGAVLNGATRFGVVGLVVAALSVLGGALSVALVDRRLVRGSAARIVAGGLGAAVGVGIVGIALGLAESSTFTAFVGLLLALPAGMIAALGIGLTDRAARAEPAVLIAP